MQLLSFLLVFYILCFCFLVLICQWGCLKTNLPAIFWKHQNELDQSPSSWPVLNYSLLQPSLKKTKRLISNIRELLSFLISYAIDMIPICFKNENQLKGFHIYPSQFSTLMKVWGAGKKIGLHLLQCIPERSEDNLWKSFIFSTMSNLGLELIPSALSVGAFTIWAILPSHVWFILNLSPSNVKSHEWEVGREVPLALPSDLQHRGHRFVCPCVSIWTALMRITFQKMGSVVICIFFYAIPKRCSPDSWSQAIFDL